MKPRRAILERIRFSSKSIIVFGVKHKIKATEDSCDLFLCESFVNSPNYMSAKKVDPQL